MFDFAPLDLRALSEKPKPFHVPHPTQTQTVTGVDAEGNAFAREEDILLVADGVNVELDLLGPESAPVLAYQKRVTQRMLDQQRARSEGLPVPYPSYEELQKEAVDLVVECTVGWRGFAYEGKPWEFNKANVRAFYEKFPKIRQRADAFVNNPSAFMTA